MAFIASLNTPIAGHVPADAVYFCDKAAVLRDVIKENSVYECEVYLSNRL